jgi:outer membrane protein assembly factor BamB
VFVSSPAVANGVVYIGSSDDTLYALKGDTGAELWRFSTLGAATSPAVANGVVYVAETDGKVYALNADSGESLWSFTTGAPIYSSPAVADGVVYVGSRDHSVYAFAQVNGSHALNVLRPPDVKSLQPDLSLKVSKPTAIRPSKGTDDASR